MVGFLVSTGVSMLMNGVCCVYQMNGERELRQAMRNDIREEWKQQREMEAMERRLCETRIANEEQMRREALDKRYQLLLKTNDLSTPTSYQASPLPTNYFLESPKKVPVRYEKDSFVEHTTTTQDRQHNQKKRIIIPATSLMDDEDDEDIEACDINPQDGSY